MLHDMNYKFSADAREAFTRYIALRKTQPLFSNARSIRNALDRMRLRQANRLVADLDRVLTADDIMSLEAADVLASRVFSNGSNGEIGYCRSIGTRFRKSKIFSKQQGISCVAFLQALKVAVGRSFLLHPACDHPNCSRSPALLRRQRIRNSIDCEQAWAGQ